MTVYNMVDHAVHTINNIHKHVCALHASMIYAISINYHYFELTAAFLTLIPSLSPFIFPSHSLTPTSPFSVFEREKEREGGREGERERG